MVVVAVAHIVVEKLLVMAVPVEVVVAQTLLEETEIHHQHLRHKGIMVELAPEGDMKRAVEGVRLPVEETERLALMFPVMVGMEQHQPFQELP